MSVEISLALLAGWAILIGWFGMRRYGTPLNPLTLFACWTIGVFTLLSGIVVYTAFPDSYPASALSMTAFVSMIYMAGVLLPYLFRGPIPARLFGKLLQPFGLNSERLATRFSYFRFFFLLGCAAVAFLLLAVVGGGGTYWLTDSRLAYLRYRAGAGPFWLLTQWFLVFAWLYYLWSRRPKALKLLLMLGVFGFLASFTGSKNNILIHGVIAVAYYNFMVKPIRPVVLAAMAVGGFVGILGLVVLQGSYADMLLALTYFDYFGTTAHFLARFDEFGFQYGKVWLTSLWFFVPRALYPDKPYEYGATLLHGVLFPGAAEAGYTPGFLSWTAVYLDFGVLGVFAMGAMGSVWQRAAYENFFRKRTFFSFLFMMHLTIWPVMALATLSMILIWSAAQALFFRLVWSKTPAQDASLGPAQHSLPVVR